VHQAEAEKSYATKEKSDAEHGKNNDHFRCHI
jgi:hypothetical protein